MKTFELTGIHWECDEYTPTAYNLPYSIEIDAIDENNAIEMLSDIYGFTIDNIDEINEI